MAALSDEAIANRKEYQRRYREANREKLNADAAAYRATRRAELAASSRAWHAQTKDKRRVVSKAYREANRDVLAEKKRQYAAANSERSKAWKRERYFGVSADQYRSMLEDCGGVCAICGGVNKSGRALAVDHCHATGKVRGLLCSMCNVAIGRLGDTSASVMRAVSYLERAERAV